MKDQLAYPGMAHYYLKQLTVAVLSAVGINHLHPTIGPWFEALEQCILALDHF